jgi:hypothetical protein
MAKETKSTEKTEIKELRKSIVDKKTKDKNLLVGKYDLSVLTDREQKYFRLMFPKSGVLYIKGEPGKAKSAMLRSIADKLNLHFIDLRLSQIDETDVGLFPDKISYTNKVEKNGKIVEQVENYLTHIVPEWAVIANNPERLNENYVGTLINFEELNRAPLAVRNAALQLLLERQIGFRGFKFGDNVFMAATGNLGEEDDTDVEEFDSALKDRLIPVRHDMELNEWRDTWANKHVHSAILGFLNVNAEYYYNKPHGDKKEEIFPTPRSWTFLSDMIRENFALRDNDYNIVEEAPLTDEVIRFIAGSGHHYIGHANSLFVKYLWDVNKITIFDILGGEKGKNSEGYIKMSKNDKESMDRSKRSELLEKLKNVDITKLKEKQIENLKLFILDLKADESCSFYLKVLDDDYDDINAKDIDPAVLSVLSDKRFTKIKKQLEDSVNSV